MVQFEIKINEYELAQNASETTVYSSKANAYPVTPGWISVEHVCILRGGIDSCLPAEYVSDFHF